MTFVRAEFDTQDTNATHFCKLSLNAQVSGLPANTVALGDTVSDLLCAGTQPPGFSDLIEAESEAQEQTQLAAPKRSVDTLVVKHLPATANVTDLRPMFERSRLLQPAAASQLQKYGSKHAFLRLRLADEGL